MESLWPKVIDSLKERVGQQNFDIWIKPIQFVSVEEEGVKLEVPKSSALYEMASIYHAGAEAALES